MNSFYEARTNDKNYDLSLPEWGPYNKKYAGFSHVADNERGITFDLDIFPGFYRRSVMNPKTLADNGTKAWRCTPDYSHVVYRYELEWKDQVYCDVHMFQNGGNCRLVCDFVNETDVGQSVQMDIACSLRFPSVTHREWDTFRAILPQGAMWIRGVDYDDIKSGQSMAVDGMRRGERSRKEFTEYYGIVLYEDNYVQYDVNSATVKQIALRYACDASVKIRLKINDNDIEINLPEQTTPALYILENKWGNVDSIRIDCTEGAFFLDGIILGDNLESTRFELDEKIRKPQITLGEKSMTLFYEMINKTYEISWDAEDFICREFNGADIGDMLSRVIHNHVSNSFTLEGIGHYSDVFIRPIFIEPHTEKTVTINVVSDPGKAVKETDDLFTFKPNESGEKYLLSQNIMSAVTMMNVAYPIRCRGKFIKHNTPGKNWDSLYTWDSGFIGLGLCAIDINRGIECLNTYLTPEGDPHSPFIEHGSWVATQAFLYQELINRTHDKSVAEKFYPLMKQYYDFYADRRFDDDQPKTGLIKCFDLFYNSGGWDDYPPQKYLHQINGTGYISPIITSSMTIIFGKIMRRVAQILDKTEDIKKYDTDIAFYEKAVQIAWDNECGYFSYVVHDDEGNFKEFLRYENGENYNKGLDGIYPYIAGAATKEQNEICYKHIKEDMLTKYGVSVVDTTASYYSDSGYWNGSVWMPHQWILWKALLDRGEYEFANAIAEKALQVWSNEVNLTYNCYEHFMLSNGRGAGFHQFSGLSTPVMLWYKTYYVPGTVDCGFSAFITGEKWNEDKTFAEISLSGDAHIALIITLNDKHDYTFEGVTKAIKVHDGTYALIYDGNGKITAKSI